MQRPPREKNTCEKELLNKAANYSFRKTGLYINKDWGKGKYTSKKDG